MSFSSKGSSHEAKLSCSLLQARHDLMGHRAPSSRQADQERYDRKHSSSELFMAPYDAEYVLEHIGELLLSWPLNADIRLLGSLILNQSRTIMGKGSMSGFR